MGPHTNLDVSDKIKFPCTKWEHLKKTLCTYYPAEQFNAGESGYRLRLYALYLKKLTPLQAVYEFYCTGFLTVEAIEEISRKKVS